MTVPSALVETHTAHVLLLGDRVLKWKKRLDLGFVDFRSLSARRQACEAEVALNRRLAPDVYLGVDTLVDADGVPVEYVVVMRRLSESTRLASLITGGVDVGASLRLVARRLADFHTRCQVSPDPEAIAGPARIRQLWDIGLDALRTGAVGVLDLADLDEAAVLVAGYLDGRGPLLHSRMAGGFVRDGHGDLLADDIFCLPDGPRILDCLDFDESLRHGDILGDMATLAMDLERLGTPGQARRLLEEYVEFSGEQHPDSLEHLYIAYRAQVRAKVALIRAAQTGDGSVRDEQRHQARLLVSLMLAHLRRTRIRLVLVGGLPGTGKTTVADGLSEATGWLVHSSDLVRRELGIPRPERYSDASVLRVYDVLLDRARQGLAQGCNVVLDATWTDARTRDLAGELADASSSDLVELECRSSVQTAEARLTRRGAAHPSDADPGVRRAMQASMDPWSTAVRIDTDGSVRAAVAAAISATSAAELSAHRSPLARASALVSTVAR